MSPSPRTFEGRGLGTWLPDGRREGRAAWLAGPLQTLFSLSGLRPGLCPRSAPRLLRIAPKHRGPVCAAAGGLGGRAHGPIPPDPGAGENRFCPPRASLNPNSLRDMGGWGETLVGPAFAFGF